MTSPTTTPTTRTSTPAATGRRGTGPSTKPMIGNRSALLLFLGYAVLVLFSFIYLYPFLVQLTTAFKTNTDAVANPLSLVADPFTAAAFRELAQRDFPLWFGNSVLVTVLVTAGRVFLCSLAGYALARIKFRGRSAVFTAILAVMAVPGVRNFGAHIGRAEVADEVVGPNFTELWISLDPSVDYEPTVARIQSIVDGYPGLYRDLLTYLRERIKEVLTGASATIVVRVYGDDLEALQAQAQTVRSAIAKVDGVADLKVQAQVLVPKVEVQFDKIEKAFDNRVASALNRLGIPSKQDVEALSAKLDELNALLERVARTQ